MKNKISIILVFLLIFTFSFSSYANAANPTYSITDTTVYIDSIPYDIVNNSISYNNHTYNIVNGTLITYDGYTPEVLVLPFEENRVTDPNEIERLDRAAGITRIGGRAIPTNPVNLPYSASVPLGQSNTFTPAFNLIVNQFYYKTYLKLTNFSSGADKRFSIIIAVCDPMGDWTTQTIEHNFGFPHPNYIKFDNMSSYRYGMFAITNLYGNPSPSYTYSIYLANT